MISSYLNKVLDGIDGEKERCLDATREKPRLILFWLPSSTLFSDVSLCVLITMYMRSLVEGPRNVEYYTLSGRTSMTGGSHVEWYPEKLVLATQGRALSSLSRTSSWDC
jgi:hypothetical protein